MMSTLSKALLLVVAIFLSINALARICAGRATGCLPGRLLRDGYAVLQGEGLRQAIPFFAKPPGTGTAQPWFTWAPLTT